MTMKQATASLTGWDILAVEKQAKTKFGDLAPMDLARYVMWIIERRTNPEYAWKEAMDVSIGGLTEYFVAEDDADPLATSTMSANYP